MIITDRQKFTFTSENDIEAISDTLNFIDTETEKFNTSKREAYKIRMMFEESLLKLLEYSRFNNNEPVTAEVSASNIMGNVKFAIRIPGEHFDFLKSIQTNSAIDSDELSPEIGDAINGILLQQFADRLRYDHRNGINYIRIAALRSPYNALFGILAAILLAVLSGILMRIYASPETCSYVQKSFLEPVSSLIMNAMKMCTIPLVFFSVMLSTASFGSLADMKRTAMRCMACFFSVQTAAAVISVGVFFILKPAMMSAAGDLAGMVVPGAEPNANFLTKIFKDLVPPSLLEPFLDNDVSQLLILGILFGLALRQADVKRLRNAFEEFNKLLIKALDIVLKFTPVIVFCSISLQVLDLGLEAVSNMAWLAVCITVCEITVMIAYCAAVRIISGMSVKRFTSSAFPAMITSASIMSTKAAIPTNMAACKKLGVPSNIYSISVPMSAIFNKQGDYVPCVVSALFLALMCGIEVSAWNVFLLAIQAIIIVIASSQMTAILVIPESLGVPSAAVQLILGITALMDIAGVALDSLGASASSVMIAGRENLRDERL